ncbi:hypothetical protein HK102_009093 [Quaeritorhiza haematococci]|nr:hypothetical protein HK102_009093 [Quaeritorhiza haematococci]
MSSSLKYIALTLLASCVSLAAAIPQNLANMDEIYQWDPQNGAKIYKLDKNPANPSDFRLLDVNNDNAPVDRSVLRPIALRIANGGGGQTGMIGALSLAYLEQKSISDVAFAWRGTNTEFSLQSIRNDLADVAIVYDIRREKEYIDQGLAQKRVVHAWMDNFNFVGPVANPAGLQPTNTGEEAIDKIMSTDGGFWLTRDDGSTIAHRESDIVYSRVSFWRERFGLPARSKSEALEELMMEGEMIAAQEAFAANGNPENQLRLQNATEYFERFWGQNVRQDSAIPTYAEYRKQCRPGFLRRIRVLPLQATLTANNLSYYTMSDNGVFFSLDPPRRSNLQAYIDGSQNGQSNIFLNPADALISTKTQAPELAGQFLDWLELESTQNTVVKSFAGRSTNRSPLYRPAFESHKWQKGESFEEFYQRRICLEKPSECSGGNGGSGSNFTGPGAPGSGAGYKRPQRCVRNGRFQRRCLN